jgi:hypothetical protein
VAERLCDGPRAEDAEFGAGRLQWVASIAARDDRIERLS